MNVYSQLRNAQIERVATLPAGTQPTGRIVYLNTDDKLYVSDGSKWKIVDSGNFLTSATFANLPTTDVATNTVAFAVDTVKFYRFDGTNWVIVGRDDFLTSATFSTLPTTGVVTNAVAFAVDRLKFYRYDSTKTGTERWVEVNSPPIFPVQVPVSPHSFGMFINRGPTMSPNPPAFSFTNRNTPMLNLPLTKIGGDPTSISPYSENTDRIPEFGPFITMVYDDSATENRLSTPMINSATRVWSRWSENNGSLPYIYFSFKMPSPHGALTSFETIGFSQLRVTASFLVNASTGTSNTVATARQLGNYRVGSGLFAFSGGEDELLGYSKANSQRSNAYIRGPNELSLLGPITGGDAIYFAPHDLPEETKTGLRNSVTPAFSATFTLSSAEELQKLSGKYCRMIFGLVRTNSARETVLRYKSLTLFPHTINVELDLVGTVS